MSVDMPIVVEGLMSVERVRVVVSPLVELGSALHVLARPEHHGREQWARSVPMSAGLAGEVKVWAWATQAIRATPFVDAIDRSEDFAGLVERLREVPAEELAGQLLRPVSGAGNPRRWGKARGPGVAALVDLLIDRPEAGTARFLDFLEALWREWFGAEWQRILPRLAARSREVEDAIARLGAGAALSALDPAVSERGGGIVIAKIQNSRHEVSRRGLSVAVSEFVRPHVYVADVVGRPLLLILPVEPDSRPVPAASVLLSRLTVLAHAGRMEICRAVASEPRTAGEIAALWHMDSTQVTRHLRALASAGLVQARREGHFVQYVLDLEAVESIGSDLVRLLLR